MEKIERAVEKVFPSGDSYYGDALRGIPHGVGKYSWSNGTIYEGEWVKGKMTGKGKVVWPSGSTYVGDLSGGHLHGHGDFTGRKFTYSGNWRMHNLYGYGKKEYANADVYEGSWKGGVREGNGRYVWKSGNSYIGGWKSGEMFGRGFMKWANGDVYYGFWLHGNRHGPGFYRFAADGGGYYFGNWIKGLKDGRGTFYPPAAGTRPSVKKWYLSAGYDGRENPASVSEQFPNGSLRRILGQISSKTNAFDEDGIFYDLVNELWFRDAFHEASSSLSAHDKSTSSDHDCVVVEREYMQGVLIRQRIKKNKNDPPFAEVKRSYMSQYLVLNLQLGIRYSVGKVTPLPFRDVRSSDFRKQARLNMFFPRKGSQVTPPHYSVDFHWKDYCPMVFRNLRALFKLDPADYMMSICGDEGLRELYSTEKSSCGFYFSHDDKFVIKTITKSEVKVLLKMLPHYYFHILTYENTLLTKFFGLHRIKLNYGRKVHFVVMGNIYCTDLKVHRRYDLKGSSYGRSTNEDDITETTALKDLDLAYEFHMDRFFREALLEQLSLDSKFLESQKIINYSLLLGLHFVAPDHRTPTTDLASNPPVDGEEVMIPPNSLLYVSHKPSSVNVVPGPHIRGSTLRAFAASDEEVDLLLPSTGRLRVQLGVNMPAQARRKIPDSEDDPSECELFEVFDVVLYSGIIDIMQDFSLRKKLEHTYKSTYCDAMSISVIEPALYSKRFINFLETVFPDS